MIFFLDEFTLKFETPDFMIIPRSEFPHMCWEGTWGELSSRSFVVFNSGSKNEGEAALFHSNSNQKFCLCFKMKI